LVNIPQTFVSLKLTKVFGISQIPTRIKYCNFFKSLTLEQGTNFCTK